MIYSLYPVLKDAIWGGEKLKTVYGKKTPLPRAAESWELSCHPDGVSSIGVAGFDGSGPVPLTEFIRIRGRSEVLGSRPAAFAAFPAGAFAEEAYLTAAAFLQSLLAAFAAWSLVNYLWKSIGLPKAVALVLLCMPLAVSLLCRFAAKPPLQTTSLIR